MRIIRTFILLAVLTSIFCFIGFTIGGYRGALIAFLIAFFMNFFTYFNSDKIVLKMFGAKEIDPNQNKELYNIIVRLSKNSNIPIPKFYIINSDQPNAFATGRNPNKGAVAVSTGLLKRLNKDEISAVIAHELAHIKNYDTLLMTVTATISGAIGMLINTMYFFGNSRNRGLAGGILMLLIVVLSPLVAGIIQMAISRTREYEADRVGADICNNPLALASALKKISQDSRIIDNIKAEDNPATAHMFIINPLHAKAVDKLFSTHPNTENRIAELKKIAMSNPKYIR